MPAPGARRTVVPEKFDALAFLMREVGAPLVVMDAADAQRLCEKISLWKHGSYGARKSALAPGRTEGGPFAPGSKPSTWSPSERH